MAFPWYLMNLVSFIEKQYNIQCLTKTFMPLKVFIADKALFAKGTGEVTTPLSGWLLSSDLHIRFKANFDGPEAARRFLKTLSRRDRRG
jgi:hypothetical protein